MDVLALNDAATGTAVGELPDLSSELPAWLLEPVMFEPSQHPTSNQSDSDSSGTSKTSQKRVVQRNDHARRQVGTALASDCT